LFFIGQLISLIGTWMQRVAQAWLVLQLTNSPFLLGLVGALQWLPVLLFSLFGGVAADRFSKRGLLVLTQTLQMILAFALGLLVLTGGIRYWHVVVLATALGLTSALDIPARQAFIFEMVEGADMMNAVALNSTIFNAARVFGPAIAGVAISTIGMAWAFLANGASFIAVIWALLLMQVRGSRVAAETNVLGHLKEGLAYLRHTALPLQVVTLVASQSVFVMNFSILVPVFAKNVLHQEAAGYGFLMSAQGVGALVGALLIAALSHLGPRPVLLFGGTAVLSLSNLMMAGVQQFTSASVTLALAGACLVIAQATANTTLQVTSPDHLRGRVMSMYALVMGGMTPIGSLVSGTLAELWGARAAYGINGAAALIGVLAVLRWRAVTQRAAPSGEFEPPAARAGRELRSPVDEPRGRGETGDP
jgi:MFS family permease